MDSSIQDKGSSSIVLGVIASVLMYATDLNLRNICNELGGIKTKWLEIGIQLGIPRRKLLEFKEDRDPLSAVVEYWLNGNTKVPVSWKSIVAALKSEHIAEPGLAEKINKKYCPPIIEEIGQT